MRSATPPTTAWTASTGCTQTAASTVECPLPNEISATLGDGDDAFTVDPAVKAPAGLLGGTGNDTLTGGAGGDSRSGGGGFDVLLGGLGDDRIADGDGAASGADVLDG